ncbi:MAG: RNA polymerase sigma factor [Desulfobaccales bacterium]
MEQFLKSVERRAFRMAEIATGSRDDAHDVLQDAMLEFVRAYGHKPVEEWKPLFYRIVQNKIRDWGRRAKVRKIFVTLLPSRRHDQDREAEDPIQTVRDQETPDPYHGAKTGEAMRRLETVLRDLPPRQQQVFLLRVWEGLSVNETATAMGCSQGSVKTHYSRALNTLQENLEDTWP